MGIDDLNDKAKCLISEVYSNPSKWEENFASAKKLLLKALEENAEHENTLINYGTVLCDYGHHKKSIEYFNKAIELGSVNRHAFFNLGVALLNTSTHKKAMIYFNKANKKMNGNKTWEAYFDPMAH